MNSRYPYFILKSLLKSGKEKSPLVHYHNFNYFAAVIILKKKPVKYSPVRFYVG